MITSMRIYKHRNGKWTVDARGELALLSIMTNTVLLADGSSVGRWQYDSWEAARDFVFGPLFRGGRGLKVIRERARVLRDRRERELERGLEETTR